MPKVQEGKSGKLKIHKATFQDSLQFIPDIVADPLVIMAVRPTPRPIPMDIDVPSVPLLIPPMLSAV